MQTPRESQTIMSVSSEAVTMVSVMSIVGRFVEGTCANCKNIMDMKHVTQGKGMWGVSLSG